MKRTLAHYVKHVFPVVEGIDSPSEDDRASSIHGNYVSKKTFLTIVEIVGTALKVMAKHPQLTTDAGEQADDNSEPEVDESVGSEHLQSYRVSARIIFA